MFLASLMLAIGMDTPALEKMAARFAPTEVAADLSGLPAQERAALGRIVQAAVLMDTLYLRQVWAGNEPLLLQLSNDATPLGRARLHLFTLQKGPWSSLDHDAPFVPGVPPRPDDANFYPPASPQDGVGRWRQSLHGR